MTVSAAHRKVKSIESDHLEEATIKRKHKKCEVNKQQQHHHHQLSSCWGNKTEKLCEGGWSDNGKGCKDNKDAKNNWKYTQTHTHKEALDVRKHKFVFNPHFIIDSLRWFFLIILCLSLFSVRSSHMLYNVHTQLFYDFFFFFFCCVLRTNEATAIVINEFVQKKCQNRDRLLSIFPTHILCKKKRILNDEAHHNV